MTTARTPAVTAEVIAIRPGPPLSGAVTVDGSKNAALPLLAAAAALRRPVQLPNVPANADVQAMLMLLQQAGHGITYPVGKSNTALILPSDGMHVARDFHDTAARIRASYYLVPALLAVHGRAVLPWPGGCRIGERGMEQHFKVYEAFGDRTIVNTHGYGVEAVKSRTGSVSVMLPFRSRGASIAAILRAVVAERPLRLGQPNLSPEVTSVLQALQAAGWETHADARIGGRRVAVTAVIGTQAFHSIPVNQRASHRVTEPDQALRELLLAHHHEVDSWVVLSHSGFDEDLKLAAVCPFLDVIFAGHCLIDQYGPIHVGETLVLKGHELGAGYALAEPSSNRWAAHTAPFPSVSEAAPPPQLSSIHEQIEDLRDRLALPLGVIAEPYRGQPLNRRLLLSDLATRLHTGLGSDAVILNETALRPTQLGDVLIIGDLLTIEPFNNQLVHARIPDTLRDAPDALLGHLTESAGPLVTGPTSLPPELPTVLTTDYLAESYLDGRTHQAGLRLRQAIQRILTEGTHR